MTNIGAPERFHQTLKGFLAKQPPARSMSELQTQVERFVAYYNDIRPHRARGRMTPRAAFGACDKARPSARVIEVGAGARVRRDGVDDGRITLRHRGRLHHIGMGRKLKGTRVLMLVNGLDIRVLTTDGELLRHLTLDPTSDFQPIGIRRTCQRRLNSDQESPVEF